MTKLAIVNQLAYRRNGIRTYLNQILSASSHELQGFFKGRLAEVGAIFGDEPNGVRFDLKTYSWPHRILIERKNSLARRRWRSA